MIRLALILTLATVLAACTSNRKSGPTPDSTGGSYSPLGIDAPNPDQIRRDIAAAVAREDIEGYLRHFAFLDNSGALFVPTGDPWQKADRKWRAVRTTVDN